MKVGFMKYLPFIVLLVGIIITAGCISPNQNTVVTPTPQIVYVTVTVTPTSTVTHVPARTFTPTPSPAPVLKTVLFSDDLSNWRSEWKSIFDATSGKTFYSGGSLHIRDNAGGGKTYTTLYKNFNDFILDVDVKTIDGKIDNWQSVDVRSQGDYDYYALAISADGYYGIQKWKNSNLEQLEGPTYSSYINTGIGAINHIHIEANKNALSFSVNGHHLKTVTDSTFNKGEVDLAATSLPSNSYTEVVFNNLVITTI